MITSQTLDLFPPRTEFFPLSSVTLKKPSPVPQSLIENKTSLNTQHSRDSFTPLFGKGKHKKKETKPDKGKGRSDENTETREVVPSSSGTSNNNPLGDEQLIPSIRGTHYNQHALAALTNTPPEEAQALQKQVDELKRGSSTGLVFKDPLLVAHGDNSTPSRQKAIHEQVGWQHAAEELDANFNTKFNKTYQGPFIDAILNGEDLLKQGRVGSEADLVNAYKWQIEELFGDLRSRADRTADENKKLRQQYKQPTSQQKIHESFQNTAEIQIAGQKQRQTQPNKIKSLIDNPDWNTNTQCVVQAIEQANLPLATLLKLRDEFTTAVSQSQKSSKRALPPIQPSQNKTKLEIASEQSKAAQEALKKARKNNKSKGSIKKLEEDAKAKTSEWLRLQKAEDNKASKSKSSSTSNPSKPSRRHRSPAPVPTSSEPRATYSLPIRPNALSSQPGYSTSSVQSNDSSLWGTRNAQGYTIGFDGQPIITPSYSQQPPQSSYYTSRSRSSSPTPKGEVERAAGTYEKYGSGPFPKGYRFLRPKG